MTNSEEKIRRRAYELWDQGGRSGNAQEYWFRAEGEIRRGSSSVNPGVNAALGGIGKHTGKCFCGVVEVVATGEPLTMGYCHCTSCRQWSGSPVNAFTIWVPEAVRITKGVETVGTFRKTKIPPRKRHLDHPRPRGDRGRRHGTAPCRRRRDNSRDRERRWGLGRCDWSGWQLNVTTDDGTVLVSIALDRPALNGIRTAPLWLVLLSHAELFQDLANVLA